MNALLKHTPVEETLLQALPTGEVADALTANGLPNRRVEGWRWSDLRGALRGPKALSQAYASEITPPPVTLAAALTLTLANGKLVQLPSDLPKGFSIKTDKPHALNMNGMLGDLAVSLAPQAVTLCVEEDIAAPIVLRFLSDGQGMHQHHLQVHVAEGVKVSFLELYEAHDSPFANGLIEFFIAQQASLSRCILQPNSAHVVQVQSALALLMAGATYSQTLLGFGGAYARFDTRVQLGGEGASAALNAAYLVDGSNHFDTTSLVEHKAMHGKTEQLIKGIVRDKARAVFQGKFLVAKGAQKTDANMQHKALLLTDQGEVNAKPELEIYADDVQCAHGNSVGALDEQAIFYMQQRGLSDAQARAMLVEAFIGEVLEKITDDSLHAQCGEMVRHFMAGDA